MIISGSALFIDHRHTAFTRCSQKSVTAGGHLEWTGTVHFPRPSICALCGPPNCQLPSAAPWFDRSVRQQHFHCSTALLPPSFSTPLVSLHSSIQSFIRPAIQPSSHLFIHCILLVSLDFFSFSSFSFVEH